MLAHIGSHSKSELSVSSEVKKDSEFFDKSIDLLIVMEVKS